jgi:beta-glucosidase
MVDEAGNRIVAPGSYTLSVGGGQPGTSAPTSEASFSIDGKLTLPE